MRMRHEDATLAEGSKSKTIPTTSGPTRNRGRAGPRFRRQELMKASYPPMISPPFGWRVCPVMYEASLDAKNT